MRNFRNSAFTPPCLPSDEGRKLLPLPRGSERGYVSPAFTLIELLIVIAIIAILSIVVVLTVNPAELLRQGRDGVRLQDMDTLTHALNQYQTDQQTSGSSVVLGASSILYLSLPDASSTCGSWMLPSLPTGWSYHCAPQTSFRNTDSNGWLPVNFKNDTYGPPLGFPSRRSHEFLFHRPLLRLCDRRIEL